MAYPPGHLLQLAMVEMAHLLPPMTDLQDWIPPGWFSHGTAPMEPETWG